MEIMNMPKKKKTNKNHLVVRNEYPRPYQCQLCDSKFDFPSKLKRHIVQMHDGENGDSTDLQPTNEINQIEGFKGFDLHSTQVPIIVSYFSQKILRFLFYCFNLGSSRLNFGRF